MNKADLVNYASEQTGLSKKDTEASLNALLGGITEALVAGDKVQLIGFGTFETRKRSARKGRNPQTGAEIEIAEAVTPAFKPGKQLKDKVN